MLVFSVSDKGGTRAARSPARISRTGRYSAGRLRHGVPGLRLRLPDRRRHLRGRNDASLERERAGPFHEYLYGEAVEPKRIDVWEETNRERLRRPIGARRLVLIPGTHGGSEFLHMDDAMVQRCADLFQRLHEEFEFCIVDLSAGRSAAMDLVLRAMSGRVAEIPARWLVFHRWTRQHVIAADHLVHGEAGLIKYGVECGFDPVKLQEMISFVRTAVIDPDGDSARILSAAQRAWCRRTPNSRCWPPRAGWARTCAPAPCHSIRCCNGASS